MLRKEISSEIPNTNPNQSMTMINQLLDTINSSLPTLDITNCLTPKSFHIPKITNQENYAPSANSTLKSDMKNRLYLNELTKISPNDYIGKDLCTQCHKIVKWTQEAISCTDCERWTHRKCCKMKKKKYKNLTKIKSFIWFCPKCRKDDPIYGNYDVLSLTQMLPEDPESIVKQKNEFIIAHLNSRSLVNKEEELQTFIDHMDPDIICITESWFDGSVPNTSHIPRGYKMIRKDRSEEFQQKYKVNKGGGVAIVYKAHLKITQKENLSEKEEDILWVHVNNRNSFLLGVVYRPSYSNMLDENEGDSLLELSIQRATEITNRMIITGDFNVNLNEPETSNPSTLIDIMKTYKLSQLIKKDTRIDINTGKGTLIDHLWATPEMNIKASGTCLGISDHLGIYAKMNKINESPPIAPKIKFRNYKNYNKEKFGIDFYNNMMQSNLDTLIKNEDVNGATELLIKLIQDTASQHAPLVIKKKRQEKKKMPFATEELKAMIIKKNQVLKDYFATNNPMLRKIISKQQNVIKNIKTKLKKKFVEEKMNLAGKDPTKLWRIYKYLTGRNQDHQETEPDFMTQTKANSFNEYFATVGDNPNFKIKSTSPTPANKPNRNTFSFQPETTTKIEKLIDKLKENTAIGNDDVGAKLIKDLKNHLTPILTKLINLGYQTCTFPNIMKNAIIRPIFKEGDTNNIRNYRPIAILPTLSKIFERAATDQLVKFLEENNILSPCQHAYRKQHSTITCLVEAVNHIHRSLDNKKHTAIALLDLSKAFDCINHDILIRKLSYQGLHPSSTSWISSYLKNRMQRTKFQNLTSEERPTTNGVPQGSILGPLLFICYTNDFPDTLKNICKPICYADDTQLLLTADSEEELKTNMKLMIEKAQSWFNENSLRINTDKTKVLIFKNNRNPEKLQIQVRDSNNTYTLTPRPFLKILGIFIDKDLNWKKQINITKRNSMNVVRNVHRINHLLKLKHKINLYNGIISPLFDYGDVLWGGCLQKDAKRLQSVQNFAIKSIVGKRKYDSASDAFNTLKILKLEQRRKIHESVFIHKALNQKSTKNLHEIFTAYKQKLSTRNATQNKLIIPQHKTSHFKKSPIYRMIKTWNSIPSSLPKNNIKLHKKHYQKHLIEAIPQK